MTRQRFVNTLARLFKEEDGWIAVCAFILGGLFLLFGLGLFATVVSIVEMAVILIFSLAPGLILTKVTIVAALILTFVVYPLCAILVVYDEIKDEVARENKNILEALGGKECQEQ